MIRKNAVDLEQIERRRGAFGAGAGMSGTTLCLVLVGPPGSGKGTQAKLLRQSMQIAHISTGDLLRERVALGDEVGRMVAELMDEGELVPDEVVSRLVEQRIEQPGCMRGFILDGYPRTVRQAQLLARLLALRRLRTIVIHLDVDYRVVVARISGRQQCPSCERLYGVTSGAPKRSGICDEDGTKLRVRDDDREEVVRERLRVYEQQTQPVLTFFKKSGYSCWDVPGTDGTPQELATTIEARIRRLREGQPDR